MMGVWTSLKLSKEDIIQDYRVALLSRHASLMGRKEVLGGKAKFGIFGDGKEIAQIAWARSFADGDWRSGYYRDQTVMMATGLCTLEQFFSQLYADTDLEHEPFSGGRQMNAHFATRYVQADGSWIAQTKTKNSSADLSPTAGQMPRLLGLAYASKLYRIDSKMDPQGAYSRDGNEVAFGTIGDASTSEGLFWEVLNAAGVLQVPMVVSVWDDGYGISVPKKYQTTKESISALCVGFAAGEQPGYTVRRVAGWDYAQLVDAYADAVKLAREKHQPALMHIEQLTQPQGHSTSGSHERYKTPERMNFEKDFDGLHKMREWMLQNNIASQGDFEAWESEAAEQVVAARNKAWERMLQPIEDERRQLLGILSQLSEQCVEKRNVILESAQQLKLQPTILRRHVASTARRMLLELQEHSDLEHWTVLQDFTKALQERNQERYSHSQHSKNSSLKVKAVAPQFADQAETCDGSMVIRKIFDHHLQRDPRIFVIGEDVGHLGGVNTEFEGLQEKFGKHRVTDTGIREATILGQGIGAAMRGLRPIVDIQYLDYVLYCLQGMSDDLATLTYRSAGGQSAPVIVRTKGHRLEGIWHTGSPMGTILHAIRGMHFCVPRDMVQAAGMYNTLLRGDDPAFVCEVLNGYRLKEKLPVNLEDFRIELGVPEILREGSDITLVTYGACVRIAEDACRFLAKRGISVELIDVCTLMPFDRYNVIGTSLSKTNALMILDEDVPGGASAFILDKILAKNFEFLDAAPITVSAKEHRGAYASDGDYYSKPSAEDVIVEILRIMHERDPQSFDVTGLV